MFWNIFSARKKMKAKFHWHYMSRVMRKLAFCIFENKDADHLRSYLEADQSLCFGYIDSTIPRIS